MIQSIYRSPTVPLRLKVVLISEYAPGRIVVINKDTYKSGGIYSFHSKFKPGETDHPARPYFDSIDYYRPLFYCDEPSCNWMGLSHTKQCPFCGKDSIQEQHLLKPWGFAPIEGRKQMESDNDAEVWCTLNSRNSLYINDFGIKKKNSYIVSI